MPNCRTALNPLLAAIFLPTALFAVDGVVLINRASAVAGNITPGDVPGFPITISQPGSYRLRAFASVIDHVVAYQDYGANVAGVAATGSRTINCIVRDNTIGMPISFGVYTGNVALLNSTDIANTKAINGGQNYCSNIASGICP